MVAGKVAVRGRGMGQTWKARFESAACTGQAAQEARKQHTCALLSSQQSSQQSSQLQPAAPLLNSACCRCRTGLTCRRWRGGGRSPRCSCSTWPTTSLPQVGEEHQGTCTCVRAAAVGMRAHAGQLAAAVTTSLPRRCAGFDRPTASPTTHPLTHSPPPGPPLPPQMWCRWW